MDVQIDQKLKRLVAQEKENRANMIELLREIDRRKLWAKAGFKSLKEYCITKFRYDEFELREILVELGHVITSRQMVDTNPKDKEGLLGINGMGDIKIKRSGSRSSIA